MAVIFCSSELRREKVRAGGALNGIDYLEVDHPAQTTLTVRFLKNLPTLDVGNFRIDGGVRIRDVRVVGVAVAGNVATVTVDQRGDFADYTLRVTAGPANDAPPPGFDARLCAVAFNFKVQCPSDFDCRPPRDCPPGTDIAPEIDYLAKDYATFRRLMLDRMAVTAPNWKERNPADMTVAIVEALAYVGDTLSYFQDSIATEAYLGTARRRTSVRRHARLLDYAVHEGCAARAFICVEVDKASSADGAVLPKGTPFLDRSLGESTQVATASIDLATVQPMVFESMHDLRLSSARNRIRLHAWSDLECCLPKGATSATLIRESGLILAPGDLLALTEVPAWRATANGYQMVREEAPMQRHVVRLKSVRAVRDAFENLDLYEVTWFAEDALPFPFCLSTVVDGDVYPDLTVACANVVLADHGQTMGAEPLIPERPSTDEVYRPTLHSTGIAFAAPYRHDQALVESATAALRTEPHATVAGLRLTSGSRTWQVRPDLLRSRPFDLDAVVETETDGTARIRFGDDVNGQAPNPIDAFEAVARVGGGREGNIGRDTLTRVVFDTPGIQNVWNPLPAVGGVDPEPLDNVRLYAPEAYKVQERAVTEADYARMAERHPEVQSAYAQFRWTGSWTTVFLVVDRLGGGTVVGDQAFRESLLRHMDRYRMAGVDLELRDPVFAPLEIVLHVCVADGYFRADVERGLLRAFVGAGGFFDPDRFTFGQDVYLSQVLATAMGVAGVDHVVAETFQRWAQTANGELDSGRLAIAPGEIAQLANDPSLPENGRIRFDLEGGL